MNDTLKHIINKYDVDINSTSPVSLPGTRLELPKLFNELGFKTGAEIGVLNGEYSKVICEAIPKVKLYCIDPWEIYDDLPEARSGSNYEIRINWGYERTKELLSPYNCEIIKKYSLDAVKDFDRRSIDFVYIDANHTFDYVTQDIIEWSRIVKPGGIVSGHDYHCFRHKEISFQISTAVNTFAKVHRVEPFFVYGGDKSTSWFFVNQ